ncbi:protein IQ-DOMAIN 1-like isoform X3 [Carex littledalei]|uniref:Protein IQ-DOMAIN 1-like isoform X3 n=1 Tax=Carex littledalei TaxID=544730 RepID=A0A833QZP8_9POAL|nr:protein IQ-DOMAIN 1-like isoform X3 [Carex littledalei]
MDRSSGAILKNSNAIVVKIRKRKRRLYSLQMGKHLLFCVDVFGRENKDEASSGQKQKSKKKWKFGRAKQHNPTPSPPVEINSPSPVPSQPQLPVEKSPSPVSFQSSPPVEEISPSPVPSQPSRAPSPPPASPPSLSPIRVTPFHAINAEETFITRTRLPTDNVEQTTSKPFAEPVLPTVTIEPEVTVTVTQFTELDVPQEILLEYPDEAEEIAPIVDVASSSSLSKEDIAATKIQAAYRGYLARRALEALKSLVRLKTLVESDLTKRQTATALKSMQSLTRVQSQVRARRIQMQEENQAMRKQLQLKHERDLERLKLSGDWNQSIQSKEQIEANLLHKQEVALRRERSLAYAYSHQWKAPSRAVTTTFLLDPVNRQWGWGWLDCWMAPRLSESSSFTLTERDSTHSTNNPFTLKTARKSLKTKFNNPNLSPERPLSPASSVMSRSSVARSVSSQKNSSVGRRNSYMKTTEAARARARLLQQTVTRVDTTPEIKDVKEKKVLVKKRASFSVPDNKTNVPRAHQPRARWQTGPHRPSDVASVKT